MTQPVASIRDLRIAFGPVEVVRGVSFDVAPNEVLGIVGESGSGKSVTALALAGLLLPVARISGSVQLGEIEVTTADAETLRKMRGRAIGLVFQDPTTSLNPVFAIGRQVIEGQVAHGTVPRGEASKRATALLREVEISDPAARATQYPHQFSGGMRQRAVIAMAMAGRPKLIIADEPTTALDVTVQAQVLGLLARRQAESGAAVVLITHDLGVIAETAHRVAVMYAGRIVETAPVAAIFAHPRHPYTRALLNSLPRLDADRERLDPIPGQPASPAALPPGCPFAPRCGHAQARCTESEPALRDLGDGQAAACHFAEALPAPAVHARNHSAPRAERGAPLLQVDSLRVHFPIRSKILRRQVGTVRAVDGVSFTLHAGETLGLVGESGCGKTTTGRAVMGLVPATGGTVAFDGTRIDGLDRTAMRGVRRRMQYVFQDPYASLNPVKAVGEIVAEPLRIHGLYDEMGGARRIAELFEMVGLAPTMATRLPREFSGGQKQRIGIARALALNPRLLILDEPVASLDVSIQAQVVNLLQDLQRELGLAYLFIAHDLAVVRHISDRVAVMYLGRIVEEAAREALYRAPLHPYTQSLLSAVPIPDPHARRQRIVLQGEVASPARPPPGCTFHPRCVRATEICRSTVPAFESGVACHHAGIRDAA
jgi:peptide/nickel transport system ATP-binding protein